MTFRLIDYLEILYEIQTEWTAKCPKCGGKLKVKKDNGAYKCVTEECKPIEIRKALGFKSKQRDTFFLPQKYVKPIALPKNYKLARIEEYTPAISYVENKTYYYYNSYFLIKRVDPLNDTEKKKFYPYFKVENKWIKSKEVSQEDRDTLSCFYYEHLIKPNDIICVLEGEKCVDFFIKNFKLKAITPPSFGWTEKWLKQKLIKLPINGILIIPDLDQAGINKAQLLQRTAWLLGIPCNLKYLPFLSEEKDIADCDTEEINLLRSKLC